MRACLETLEKTMPEDSKLQFQTNTRVGERGGSSRYRLDELELELIQTHMTQKPMLWVVARVPSRGPHQKSKKGGTLPLGVITPLKLRSISLCLLALMSEHRSFSHSLCAGCILSVQTFIPHANEYLTRPEHPSRRLLAIYPSVRLSLLLA